MQIRQLQVNEYDKALTLSLDVFIQCGKNDFDEEGLKTFKSFIYNKDLVNELTIYGAFEGESLIGLIATKNEGKHISLFFITPMYHGKGIGKRLFDSQLLFLCNPNLPEIRVRTNLRRTNYTWDEVHPDEANDNPSLLRGLQ